jgi:hypothetical protein
LAAVRLSPEEVQSLLRVAEERMPDHLAVARTLLQGLVELEGGHALVWNHLGLAHLHAEQIKSADQCFKKALFLDGNLQPAIQNLKRLHLARHRKPSPREQALEASMAAARGHGTVAAWEDIVKHHPHAVEAYNELGMLLYAARDYDRAEEFLVQGLEQYYVFGMQVDHQYFILKENLAKLRDVREQLVKNAHRPTHDVLAPGEQSLATVAGDIRLSHTGELRRHGVFVATSKRIVVMWPEGDKWQEETIPYESVKGVKINFGIVRAVMVLTTRTDEIYFSTLSKDEAKTALTIIRSMMRRTSETSMVDDIIVHATDMSNKTAVLLLKALNELNVLTDDEYRYKVTAVERNGQPERTPALAPPPRRMREPI